MIPAALPPPDALLAAPTRAGAWVAELKAPARPRRVPWSARAAGPPLEPVAARSGGARRLVVLGSALVGGHRWLRVPDERRRPGRSVWIRSGAARLTYTGSRIVLRAGRAELREGDRLVATAHVRPARDIASPRLRAVADVLPGRLVLTDGTVLRTRLAAGPGTPVTPRRAARRATR